MEFHFLYSLPCLFVGFYVAHIFSYCWKWFKMPSYLYAPQRHTTKISVIIPVRNEENEITRCLKHVVNQDYPSHLLEFLVVDDYSEDDTEAVVKNFIKTNSSHNIRLLHLRNETGRVTGKKNAINLGVRNSTGSLIVTTDADCIMGEKWLCSIAGFYEKTGAKMIIAPVLLYPPLVGSGGLNNRSFVNAMLSLEQIGLTAIAGATAFSGHPLLCSGANLSFEKNCFEEVGGHNPDIQSASGDDIFLLNMVRERYNDKIHYIKSVEATVYTKSPVSFLSFFNQRKRWASKIGQINDYYTRKLAFHVYFSSFSILFTVVMSMFFPYEFYPYAVILFSIKFLIDFLFLFLASGFFGNRRLMFYFLPAQTVHFIYVSVIGMLGLFTRYSWKDRNYAR